MPHVARLRTSAGDKAYLISFMLYPFSLIREKWTNTWQKYREEVLVLVYHENHVVRRLSPATNTFIMTHPEFSNKEIYSTQRMVQII